MDIQLDPLIVQVREGLGRGTYLSETAQLRYLVDTLTVELRAHVLAHQLPPETVVAVVSGDTEAKRFATWWDHFKATYRARWWMLWRRWDINYTTVKVPYEHLTNVTVRGAWTFPEARIYPPELGAPVYVTITEPMHRRRP